jgi:hypothetical protein
LFEQCEKTGLIWECKECRQLFADDQVVAYHLINGDLYGWCEACFAKRHSESSKIAA